MFPPLAQFIDWLFLQKAFFKMPEVDERSFHLEEAIRFLQTTESFPAESEPARIELIGEMRFQFPSPRPCRFAENNIVHGRLYCGARQWRERPTIILLHGGNLMLGGKGIGKHLQAWTARHCLRAGFNAVTMELPYHFQRYPHQPGALNNLDFLRMAEAAAQAIAEIRAVIGWLLLERCPGVALWGTSMGAQLTGLTLCHDNRLSAAVMSAPGVCSDRRLAEHIIWPHARKIVRTFRDRVEKIDSTRLNLLTQRPAIPKEKILLIEPVYDLFTPKEPIEKLWQTWGCPEIWRIPHGHLTKTLAPGLKTKILRWLSEILRTKQRQTDVLFD